MTTTTRIYTSNDLARAADLRPDVASRLAPVLGLPALGSGGRYRYTLGELLVARGLRGWTGRAGARTARNAEIRDLFFAHGPSLIDGTRVLPRYLVCSGRTVAAAYHPEQIARAVHGTTVVHVIDVDAAYRSLEAEELVPC